MSIREIYLAHELDAAWIIALWKAIHGGDGGPEQIPAQAIAALAQYVTAPARTSFSFAELKAQFAKLSASHRGRRGVRSSRRQASVSHVRGRRARVPHSPVLFQIQRRDFLHGTARPYPLANRRLKNASGIPPARFTCLVAGSPACASSAWAGDPPAIKRKP